MAGATRVHEDMLLAACKYLLNGVNGHMLIHVSKWET
jgi:hypothetical protein